MPTQKVSKCTPDNCPFAYSNPPRPWGFSPEGWKQARKNHESHSPKVSKKCCEKCVWIAAKTKSNIGCKNIRCSCHSPKSERVEEGKDCACKEPHISSKVIHTKERCYLAPSHPKSEEGKTHEELFRHRNKLCEHFSQPEGEWEEIVRKEIFSDHPYLEAAQESADKVIALIRQVESQAYERGKEEGQKAVGKAIETLKKLSPENLEEIHKILNG